MIYNLNSLIFVITTFIYKSIKYLKFKLKVAQKFILIMVEKPLIINFYNLSVLVVASITFLQVSNVFLFDCGSN